MFELNSQPKTPALPGHAHAAPPMIFDAQQTGTLSSLSRLLNMLIRRRVVALSIFGAFVLMVALGTWITPKGYTTQVKFIAGNPGGSVAEPATGADSNLPVLNALLIASGEQSGETYAELFQELPVAQQVVTDLKLNTSPEHLLSNVTVKPITNTSILTLSATWSSPETSAAIANDFAKVIVQRERDLVGAQAKQAIDFLNQELPGAEQRMHDTSTALAAYEAQHHLMDVTNQTQTVITNYADLDSKLNQARVDARQASAQLASAQSQMARTPATISGDTSVAVNPTYSALQAQITTLETQLATARQQYTDQHPAVISLVNQINAVKRQLATTQVNVVANSNTIPNPQYQQLQQQVATYTSQQASVAAQIGALTAQRRALAPQLAGLPSAVAQLADLQRQAKSAQDVVSALQEKFDSASIAKSTALSDVTVTQPASADAAAVAPSVVSNTLLAMILGVFLAIGGVLVLDYFDSSIKNEGEAEERLALPSLGSVPDVRRKNGEVVPWVRALAIESFLQLITALKYSSDIPMRSFAVTSPSQGDGKSTVALNTAIAMAELEPRVLLIDGDLRRPTLHTKLGLKDEAGLSDILVGRQELHNVVRATRYPGLDILPAGTPPPNPIKLLQSARLDQLIEQALETYRYVFVDTAACSANFDSAIVSSKVAGTMVVVAAGMTEARAAKNALRKLEQIGVKNIVGFVLN